MRLTRSEIAALCYADVFDYPLTKEELQKFRIAGKSVRTGFPKKSDRSSDQSVQKITELHKGYYTLKNRGRLVSLREKREHWATLKLQTAIQIARLLRYIPAIRLIAVSGALAMRNTDYDDDIDLLIVTKAGLLWTTRFLAVGLVEFLGKRRRPSSRNIGDKICLNMFVDEAHLGIPKNEQDVFSAHEVAQMKILWGREETIRRFRKENEWIRKYLPNIKYQISESKNTNFSISQFLNFIECIVRQLQLFYMKNHRTNEVVRDGYLRFHPNDARTWILPAFEKRLRRHGMV